MAVQFVLDKRKIRSHRKSRGGCESCKERKTKCCETRPKCNTCVRTGRPCVYSDDQVLTQQPVNISPVLSNHGLNLTDLRLLHHYMLYARPYLPLGREHTWVTDILCRAMVFPHLMHAILALSASHLGTYDTSLAQSVSLSHRQQALAGISSAFSAGEATTEAELDILTHASAALLFQASYMPDGFYDFVRILRGTGALAVATLSKQNDPDPTKTILEGARKSYEIKGRFRPLIIDKRISDAAIQSLLNVEYLCQASRSLQEFHQMQLVVLHALQESPWEGYIQLAKLYNMIMLQPPEVSAELFDTDDPVARILQAHMLSLIMIFTPLRLYEFGPFARWKPMEAMVAWIERICGSLGDNFAPYVAWPSQISHSLTQFGETNRLTVDKLAALVLDRPELFLMPD